MGVSSSTQFLQRPCKEINKHDIQELADSFAQAARRAKTAGFDGVEIHSGHGYLLSQFLSPAFNQRQDEYGGDISNRIRLHLEIFSAIRQLTGPDYPVLIKLNCQDFIENGLSLEDSIKAAIMLEDAGIDAIELSGGIVSTGKLEPSRIGINSLEKEAYFKEEARLFKDKINIPLILVGGLRSFELAEHLLKEDYADYISMSRPFIMEPGLINRWKSGDHSKARCKSENLCLKSGRSGNGVYCVVNEKSR